ncbi:uncharacterized protein BDW70DRAFT_4562 [Aspergillus foveolatus]|uniref:uncharacterized protein n=1 Tax=Aspergillus foveolatus TaxID=210207 RepID=UPI003CCC90D7
MNRNPNLNTGRTGNSSFTDQFNANVDYTRSKMGQGRGDTTGMGQSETQTYGQNLAQAQADAQNEVQAGTAPASRGPAVGTGSSGANLGDDFSKGPSELETSIDSTNAGVDHRRTSYSFTAATLAHPNDRAGPDE